MQICYIPYKKSIYDQARSKLNKLSPKERAGIASALTIIAAGQLNALYAKGLNVAEFTKRIDTKGLEILGLIQVVGYWAAIIFAAIDIVKSIKKQDIAGVIAIAAKYAITFGLLYALPAIFDMIKVLFV